MRLKNGRLRRIFELAFCMVLFCGCGGAETETAGEAAREDKGIRIGLSFDSFIIERWQRDRDAFVARASELGAEVNVQCANGEAREQAAQIEYLMTGYGCDCHYCHGLYGTERAGTQGKAGGHQGDCL